MNCFQQTCPNCHASLELPSEADGRSAICPACQSTFVASADQPSTSDAVRDDSTKQHSAPTESVPKKVPIELILGETLSVFSSRRQPLVLPFMIPFALLMIWLVVTTSWIQKFPWVTKLDYLTVGFVFLIDWLLMSYGTWLAFNLAIKLCDAPSESADRVDGGVRSWIIPPPRLFLVALVLFGLIAVVLTSIVVLAGLVVRRGLRAGTWEVQLLVGVGAFAMTLFAIVFAMMRLWPIIPLVLEGRTLKQALFRSLAMTERNLTTSFLLSAVVLFFLGIATGLYGIGLVVAVPLSALTLVVAQRLIEGRLTDASVETAGN